MIWIAQVIHHLFRSIGYQYDWKIEEAQKNLLRTHTTAVSARMLYKLAQEKEFKPVKYFSIDRVFRNETLDSTHLAEFHQVCIFQILDQKLTTAVYKFLYFSGRRRYSRSQFNFGRFNRSALHVFSKIGCHEIKF